MKKNEMCCRTQRVSHGANQKEEQKQNKDDDGVVVIASAGVSMSIDDEAIVSVYAIAGAKAVVCTGADAGAELGAGKNTRMSACVEAIMSTGVSADIFLP